MPCIHWLAFGVAIVSLPLIVGHLADAVGICSAHFHSQNAQHDKGNLRTYLVR